MDPWNPELYGKTWNNHRSAAGNKQSTSEDYQGGTWDVQSISYGRILILLSKKIVASQLFEATLSTFVDTS